MPLYLSFYFIGVLLVAFFKDRYFKIISNVITFFIICVVLLCFAGFRYGIATDYWSYRSIFYKIGQYDRIEGGFGLLIKFYKENFSSSYNGFIFFIAFLSISLKYLFFKELNNPFLALAGYIAFFYLSLEYNAIRQGLAIAFIFLAVYWAKKEKPVIFLILTGLASSIHISSILFIPCYFFLYKKRYINVLTVCFFILLALCARYFFIEIFLNFLTELFSGTTSAIILQLQNYLKIGEFSIINLGVFRRITVIILFILLNNKKNISSCYFHFYLIGTLLYILLMGNDIFAHRMSLSFDAFMIPLFADMAVKHTYKNAIIVYLLVSVFLVLYLITIGEEGYVLPYQTHIFTIKN